MTTPWINQVVGAVLHSPPMCSNICFCGWTVSPFSVEYSSSLRCGNRVLKQIQRALPLASITDHTHAT